jgi:hypothetical protein
MKQSDIEIIYEMRNGGSAVMRLGHVVTLYETLSNMRKRGIKWAEAWTIDEYGVRIEQVGGIKDDVDADDRRIHYQVWAERDPINSDFVVISSTCKAIK